MLEARGHNVKSMLTENPSLSDFRILQIAIAENRIIVTMDKDFGELVFHSSFDHKGIVLLRLEDMNGNEKTEVMNYILDNFENRIEENFCVFKNGKLRVRHK